jgi:hypothetical protein
MSGAIISSKSEPETHCWGPRRGSKESACGEGQRSITCRAPHPKFVECLTRKPRLIFCGNIKVHEKSFEEGGHDNRKAAATRVQDNDKMSVKVPTGTTREAALFGLGDGDEGGARLEAGRGPIGSNVWVPIWPFPSMTSTPMDGTPLTTTKATVQYFGVSPSF